MKPIVKRILHLHEWRTVKTRETEYYDSFKRVIAVQYTYIQECELCRKMRIYTFES